jgi:hypothetical protein
MIFTPRRQLQPRGESLVPRRQLQPRGESSVPRWQLHSQGKKFDPRRQLHSQGEKFAPRRQLHSQGKKFAPRRQLHSWGKKFAPRRQLHSLGGDKVYPNLDFWFETDHLATSIERSKNFHCKKMPPIQRCTYCKNEHETNEEWIRISDQNYFFCEIQRMPGKNQFNAARTKKSLQLQATEWIRRTRLKTRQLNRCQPTNLNYKWM